MQLDISSSHVTGGDYTDAPRSDCIEKRKFESPSDHVSNLVFRLYTKNVEYRFYQFATTRYTINCYIIKIKRKGKSTVKLRTLVECVYSGTSA